MSSFANLITLGSNISMYEEEWETFVNETVSQIEKSIASGLREEEVIDLDRALVRFDALYLILDKVPNPDEIKAKQIDRWERDILRVIVAKEKAMAKFAEKRAKAGKPPKRQVKGIEPSLSEEIVTKFFKSFRKKWSLNCKRARAEDGGDPE